MSSLYCFLVHSYWMFKLLMFALCLVQSMCPRQGFTGLYILKKSLRQCYDYPKLIKRLWCRHSSLWPDTMSLSEPLLAQVRVAFPRKREAKWDSIYCVDALGWNGQKRAPSFNHLRLSFKRKNESLYKLTAGKHDVKNKNKKNKPVSVFLFLCDLVNFEALVITIAVVFGVIVLGLLVCCCCCCVRCKKTQPRWDGRAPLYRSRNVVVMCTSRGCVGGSGPWLGRKQWTALTRDKKGIQSHMTCSGGNVLWKHLTHLWRTVLRWESARGLRVQFIF